MKKSELKIIIKECVKEILFEEGVLSGIIAEVALGLNSAQGTIVESQRREPTIELQEKLHTEKRQKEKERIMETKKKMLSAIGSPLMQGAFEGTEPLSEGSVPAHSPLHGMSPSDAGVDITNLVGLAGSAWKKLK